MDFPSGPNGALGAAVLPRATPSFPPGLVLSPVAPWGRGQTPQPACSPVDNFPPAEG